MTLYEKLFIKGEKRRIFVLLDPDKLEDAKLRKILGESEESPVVAGYFVGSTLLFRENLDGFVKRLKAEVKKPVILFPGSHAQITRHADAILFLSLLSGRNPQYLIEEQVRMAPVIKFYGLEAISTAYLLVESGGVTSVEWVTNTRPLPRNKKEIVWAHALTASMLGFKLIYLEAGSGALKPVPPEIIEVVKNSVDIPVIVGGGLRTPEDIKVAFDAGADFLVIGNKIEEDPLLLRRLYV